MIVNCKQCNQDVELQNMSEIKQDNTIWIKGNCPLCKIIIYEKDKQDNEFNMEVPKPQKKLDQSRSILEKIIDRITKHTRPSDKPLIHPPKYKSLGLVYYPERWKEVKRI